MRLRCQVCGKPFGSFDRRKKTCSDACYRQLQGRGSWIPERHTASEWMTQDEREDAVKLLIALRGAARMRPGRKPSISIEQLRDAFQDIKTMGLWIRDKGG